MSVSTLTAQNPFGQYGAYSGLKIASAVLKLSSFEARNNPARRKCVAERYPEISDASTFGETVMSAVRSMRRTAAVGPDPIMVNAPAPPDRRSTEYFKALVPKDIEKNAAPIRAAGLSMQ